MSSAFRSAAYNLEAETTALHVKKKELTNPEGQMSTTPVSAAARRAELAGVVVTALLDQRPYRAPDLATEISSMHRLAQSLNASSNALLKVLADIALNFCGGGSAGISLLQEREGRVPVVRLVTASGVCAGAVDTIAPIDECPSGITLGRGTPQLFALPGRHFALLRDVRPEVIEELVVPIPGESKPVGTLWIMSHNNDRLFDAEDRRILTSLANFTGAALGIAWARADAEARAARAEWARSAVALPEARRDDFVALLSHELRNPLGSIDSALTAARQLAVENPALLSVLCIADRQLGLLKRLVNDLVDASRIRHGKLSIQRSFGLLQDVVADAVTVAKGYVDDGRLRLHISVPPYPVTVHADLARLTQIVSNVLANAMKYSPAGGDVSLLVEAPDLSIEQTCATRHETIMTVKDSGIGIPASLLPHVFDMFVQSTSARKHVEGGLGIGLAVVKHLVTAHYGTIEISSAGEGLGTEVTIRLPIVCKKQGASVVSAPGHKTNGRRRILVVDDSADATEALGALLGLEGHEVRLATSGRDALSILESFTPDVALIDICMPDMDGVHLAHLLRLRAQCSSTKLVALTGYTNEASRIKGHGLVFDAHLTKPLSLDDLAYILRPS